MESERFGLTPKFPEAELPNLPAGADIQMEQRQKDLPNGSMHRIWRQSFDVDADFELPEVEHAEMGSLTLPDGSVKRTFRPKGGFKWPEIHLPKFHLPDWHFHRAGSKERSPSPGHDDRDHGFSMKMPSFGFGGQRSQEPFPNLTAWTVCWSTCSRRWTFQS